VARLSGKRRAAPSKLARGVVSRQVPRRRRNDRRAAQERQAVVAGFLGHRFDLDGRVAAEAAEKDCQPTAYLRKQDTGSVVDGITVQTTGKGVPQFPDGFFGFPWLEVDP